MPTSVRLSADAEARLDALAVKTGRTKAYYLRAIIDRGLDDLEDYYLGEDVLLGVRAGRDQVVSHEDLWRGLDD